jgi:hypothetical protein
MSARVENLVDAGNRSFCTIPHHPRTMDGYTKPCRGVKGHIKKLEALAQTGGAAGSPCSGGPAAPRR